MPDYIKITGANIPCVRFGGIYEVCTRDPLDNTHSVCIIDDDGRAYWPTLGAFEPFIPSANNLVRCIDDKLRVDRIPRIREITEGRLYEVLDLNDHKMFDIRDNYGDASAFFRDRFEFVAAPTSPATPQNKEAAPMFTHLLVTFEKTNKIYLIKELRRITGAGLREVNDMVENGITFQTASHILDLINSLTAAYKSGIIDLNGRPLSMPKLTITPYVKPEPVLTPVSGANYNFYRL